MMPILSLACFLSVSSQSLGKIAKKSVQRDNKTKMEVSLAQMRASSLWHLMSLFRANEAKPASIYYLTRTIDKPSRTDFESSLTKFGLASLIWEIKI